MVGSRGVGNLQINGWLRTSCIDGLGILMMYDDTVLVDETRFSVSGVAGGVWEITNKQSLRE